MTLEAAIMYGDIDRVKYILHHNPYTYTYMYKDLFVLAMDYNQFNIAKIFIDKGFIPSFTELKYAVRKNSVNMVKLILSVENLIIQNYINDIIDIAMSIENLEIFKFLLADGRIIPKHIHLMTIIEKANIEYLKLLLADRRVDPRHNNYQALNQVLNYVLEYKNNKCYILTFKLLLMDNRIDPNFQNNAFFIKSIEGNNPEIIRILLSHPLLNINNVIPDIIFNILFYSQLEINFIKYIFQHPKFDIDNNSKGIIEKIKSYLNLRYMTYRAIDIINILLEYPKIFELAMNEIILKDLVIKILIKILNLNPKLNYDFLKLKDRFLIYYGRFLDAEIESLQYLSFKALLRKAITE